MTPLLLSLLIVATPTEDYERVKPVLAQHCFKCHDGEKPKAGLSLASAEKALAGSRSGPVVTAGNVDGSLIIQCWRPGTTRTCRPMGS